jgi:hypothetical protein
MPVMNDKPPDHPETRATDPEDTTSEAGADAEGAAEKRERIQSELGDWRARAAEGGENVRVPRRPFLARREIMLIFMLLIALFCIVALKRPCAQGVSRFMGSFEEPDGGPVLRKPAP